MVTCSGTSCSDFDECALGLDTCSDYAPCSNTAGSFSCGDCNSGYFGPMELTAPRLQSARQTPGLARERALHAHSPGGATGRDNGHGEPTGNNTWATFPVVPESQGGSQAIHKLKPKLNRLRRNKAVPSGFGWLPILYSEARRNSSAMQPTVRYVVAKVGAPIELDSGQGSAGADRQSDELDGWCTSTTAPKGPTPSSTHRRRHVPVSVTLSPVWFRFALYCVIP